ncbi:dimethylsulfonioproprionate lyase DddP [Pseudoruegeria sp. HB172150]|uniref:dimethylsulfonioproprionate lyase DddP n=1 Tax=Pseudoruegeria sp. HB172150 TaxID=2721164 RepID=UPI001553B90E|nr:dimethylsulfonioproprionate lyase DddP [Pseudoruegeria sp. HB172150]
MTQFYRDARKIDPTKGPVLGDGTPNDADRCEIGPTELAYGEWEAAGLVLPDLARMREYRWRRLVEGIVARDWGGVVLTDPLNIRYATDSTNMQLWNMHNPFRALFVGADGYMAIWDYERAPFLTEFNPLVRERIRETGADFFYFDAGDVAEDKARAWAGKVDSLVREHGGSNKRLGIDKLMLHGVRALEELGYDLMEGEELTEKARVIKGPDEILAMRCAVNACEAAMAEMEAFAREFGPTGMVSENDVWAQLHLGNIRRGGEWIETRLLASGPRTNPWFQECGPRKLQNNEILAFDTDLVGSYGICVDISRTWWIGDEKPTNAMIYAMRHGHEHIMTNMELLAPGVPMRDLTFNAHKLDDRFQELKYGCMMHGVGLCDEWPRICYPDGFDEGAYEYLLEPGMVLCVEALVAEPGGGFSIKLEDQVLITDTGYELLTWYPYDAALMGTA